MCNVRLEPGRAQVRRLRMATQTQVAEGMYPAKVQPWIWVALLKEFPRDFGVFGEIAKLI